MRFTDKLFFLLLTGSILATVGSWIGHPFPRLDNGAMFGLVLMWIMALL